jgi:spermidine synthase
MMLDASALRLVLGALFLSGVASIVNQVVWQRALKIFLGGSEAISAMVVVLVFMLGLGIGAGIAGVRARRLRNPLRAFGQVELGLFAVNSTIAVLLSLDLGESLHAAQRLALSAGISLRFVYAVGALALLLPPTILMGATLPLAAEACQRQLGANEARLITILLVLNTVGACVGAIGSSFLLLPYLGQRVSLFAAAAFNLAAGVVAVALASGSVRRAALPSSESAAPSNALAAGVAGPVALRRLTLEEKLGCVLGFLSLGYEMVLLRLVSLAHEPRPFTFAFTLLFFLLFWTFGVWLAGRMTDRGPWVSAAGAVLAVGALLVALVPSLYELDRWTWHLTLYRGGLAYFLPCVAFGVMYGSLVSRAASEWGRDVGRFYALNTLGSCLGILFFSLVGYEIRHDFNAYLIALGLVGVWIELWIARGRGSADAFRSPVPPRALQGALALGAVALLASGLSAPFTESTHVRSFFGRDGVIEVRRDGAIWIDGLWHSEFSDGTSHIGNPYNWMMAVAAVLAHRDEPMTDGLVVGNGLGLTATTLSRLEGMNVDAYEINRTFAEILRLYPMKTLDSAANPRIALRWQDGRSGLALDPKRYDIIISAPLHLRAAGSSSLLSREYLTLAKSRLKPNGVMVLYSQEGRPEQGGLIRATVRSVFPYMETFWGGVLTVASETPIEITQESVVHRMRRKSPLAREMAAFDRLLRKQGEEGLYSRFDSERLPVPETSHRITDDHPLVEYPDVTARLLEASRGESGGH